MHGVLRRGGHDAPATAEALRAALAGADFFWLDIDDDTPDGTAADLLREEFHFHPLALEAAEHFAQRPRIASFDDFVYLVARGADPAQTGVVEVHCFVSDHYVVTVHRGDCPAVGHARERLERHPATGTASPQLVVVYLVLGSLVDTFFPVLSDLDDRIDALEEQILRTPTEAQLGELFAMKRTLIDLRKDVVPQRDMMASITGSVTDVPGMNEEAARYFRDLYDRLIRLADLVDNYRDLLSSVMDTHLSTVSNRLNVVMKQLAVIATVFLPLTFLTGFFGQNFAYLVQSIAPRWAFWVLGVGLELVAVVVLLTLFRRRGWLGGPTV